MRGKLPRLWKYNVDITPGLVAGGTEPPTTQKVMWQRTCPSAAPAAARDDLWFKALTEGIWSSEPTETQGQAPRPSGNVRK